MKIVTIVGARPQFVKAAVVSRAIASYNAEHAEIIREVLVHTGQHYDHNMSDIFFREMCIPAPDYHLSISRCTHGAMTGRMLEQIESVLLLEKPDVVLVYGDTNSTLAGALAAAKLSMPIAHVEAGLRSYNMKMPEEINRILTDRVSQFLFCPTQKAVDNLRIEGLFSDSDANARKINVVRVGDVMYDAVLYYRKMARQSDAVRNLMDEAGGAFYLATVHRAENTDNPSRLNNIIDALRDISQKTAVIFPLHPRTRKKLDVCDMTCGRIRMIDPVGYFDMLTLLGGCKGVFTDSGGLQKEAYFFQKPCITLRDETEWIELVENGFNCLVGADKDRIIEAEGNLEKKRLQDRIDLYGTGNAGREIIVALERSI